MAGATHYGTRRKAAAVDGRWCGSALVKMPGGVNGGNITKAMVVDCWGCIVMRVCLFRGPARDGNCGTKCHGMAIVTEHLNGQMVGEKLRARRQRESAQPAVECV